MKFLSCAQLVFVCVLAQGINSSAASQCHEVLDSTAANNFKRMSFTHRLFVDLVDRNMVFKSCGSQVSRTDCEILFTIPENRYEAFIAFYKSEYTSFNTDWLLSEAGKAGFGGVGGIAAGAIFRAVSKRMGPSIQRRSLLKLFAAGMIGGVAANKVDEKWQIIGKPKVPSTVTALEGFTRENRAYTSLDGYSLTEETWKEVITCFPTYVKRFKVINDIRD